MSPLMLRNDYGTNAPSAGPCYDDPNIVIVPSETAVTMPNDYDSPILEETVPQEQAMLKCPYCGSKNTFNQERMAQCQNFSCPSCAGKVPTITVIKQANNEYISSIELVTSEENDVVNDLKDSLKVVKKLAEEDIDAASFGRKKNLAPAPETTTDIKETPSSEVEQDTNKDYPILNGPKFKLLMEEVSQALKANKFFEDHKGVQDLADTLHESVGKVFTKSNVSFLPVSTKEKIFKDKDKAPEDVQGLVHFLMPDVSTWAVSDFMDNKEKILISKEINNSYTELEKKLKPEKSEPVNKPAQPVNKMDEDFKAFLKRPDIKSRYAAVNFLRKIANMLLKREA